LAIQERRHSCNANRWRFKSVDTPDNANRWRSKSVDALIDVLGTNPGASTELAGDAWVYRLRHGHVLPVSGDSQ